MSRIVFAVAAGAVISIACAAHAQTGPALMLKPWDDATVELRTAATIFGDGEIDTGGAGDFDLRRYELAGRALLGPKEDRAAVGVDLTYLDFNGGRLLDHSVGVSFGLERWDDWELGAVIGVGYASDTPYTDAHGLYAMGDLILSRKLDDDSSIQILLNYNGNRAIWPDLPIPAIAYHRKAGEALSYTLGLPFSSLRWTPADRLTVELVYGVPVTLNATITYDATDQLALFAAFRNSLETFFIDGTSGRRRTFFQQRRLEAGVRWQAAPLASLELAGGFAFDQQLETGWDVRDLSNKRELSDEPYVRLALRLMF